jgi:hypothetical protein
LVIRADKNRQSRQGVLDARSQKQQRKTDDRPHRILLDQYNQPRLVAELTDRLLGGIVLYLLTVGMGEFVNPGERSGRDKCQRRDHRLMLPKFLILPPTDPLVRRFATFVKQGDAYRGTP